MQLLRSPSVVTFKDSSFYTDSCCFEKGYEFLNFYLDKKQTLGMGHFINTV